MVFETRRAAVEEHVETAVASRRVVSYIRMAEIRGEWEKEDGIEQKTPPASTCLFMCVYECDEGCIQSSVLPSCIEQILILKAYLFARPDASLPRIFSSANHFRLYTSNRATMFIHSHTYIMCYKHKQFSQQVTLSAGKRWAVYQTPNISAYRFSEQNQ